MSSFYLKIYVKSSDSEMNKLLGKLLKELFKIRHHGLEKQRPKIIKLVTSISPTKGAKTWQALESLNKEKSEDFSGTISFDHINSEKGERLKAKTGEYWIVDLVAGSRYEEVFSAITTFFGSLSAKIDVRGYGCYSGDPVDIFYRFVKGNLVIAEHVPYAVFNEDEQAIKDEYIPWHKGLPKEIKMGQLTINVEGKHIVFAGDPSKETLKSIESAKKLGMMVEEKVSDNTDYMVVCGPATKRLLTKLGKEGALMIGENVFNWSLSRSWA